MPLMPSAALAQRAAAWSCGVALFPRRPLPLILALVGMLGATTGARAQPAATPASADGTTENVPTVVVTGSIAARRLEEAPYAITAVGRDALRSAGPMMNVSEALTRVPGLTVNNRSNLAQDLQITSRGFGARATFGVRGLRIYTDGIPATGPDGQGQVSHVDIASAERIEVLRGPFSALYGNSSGGVLATFTAPVRRDEWNLDAEAGAFGLRQLRAGLAKQVGGGVDLRFSASTARLDGFRPQSAAEKTQAQLHGTWRGERDTVTWVLNSLDQPSDDPLGLSKAQFALGPDQVASVATQFDTRKLQRQTQTGLNWRHRFDDSALRELSLSLYAGTRGVTQWLAIAPATQANARHGGGVVDFDRRFEGAELRTRWALGTVDLSAGLSWDRQRDDRRGYENFTGTGTAQQLGVIGRLRRDETNFATASDAFFQADGPLATDMAWSAGLRTGRVKLSSRDVYLSNGDDSGAARFAYRTPVLGWRWRLAPSWQVFASAAKGFESPTLGELAYRADGTGGFNLQLQPQRSRQVELGLRWREAANRFDVALFEIHTRDEIGVATNAGGRSAFQNVGRTRREGVEVSGDWQLSPSWSTSWAAHALRARYRDNFLVCAGIPCTAPSVQVPAGNRIAGASPGQLWAEAAWHGGTWGVWGLEVRGVAGYFANDRNSAAAAVPGYGLAALRWSRTWWLGPEGSRLETLVRVDNLFDRRHAASVIVNDANDRYFEPGAPRQWLLALRYTGRL